MKNRLFPLLCLCLSLVFCFCSCETGKRSFDYYVDDKDKTCLIAGPGDMNNVDLVIPEKIDGYRVTLIEKLAFEGCSWINSVTIPSGVNKIGNSAFRGCSSLTAVYISDLGAWCEMEGINCLLGYNEDIDVYLNGKLITDPVIPNGTEKISNYAFGGFDSLNSVTIPSSVTSFGYDVFAGCENLATIFYDGTREEWKEITKQTGWDYNTGDYIVDCTNGTLAKEEASK